MVYHLKTTDPKRTGASFYTWLGLLLGLILTGCASSVPGAKIKPLRTQNIVVVVIDGPRYSETWGAAPGIIPNMSTKLRPQGVFFSNFRNEGYTYTNAGHTAITTGVRQPIDNYGAELPAHPSIMQYWLKKTGKPATAAWLITSKDKLNILANTTDSLWQNKYQPSTNCGVNGPGTGYRADSLTLLEAKRIMAENHPNLVFINFMEPDGYAHAVNWEFYLRGISRSDRYVKQLWDFLQKDKNYRKKTTLLVTNDHGRHLDTVDGGWAEHGDDCDGCQHISLLALGPDFKRGATVTSKYTLVDIPSTIAPMLGFRMEQSEGQIILDLFSKKALKRIEADTLLLPKQ